MKTERRHSDGRSWLHNMSVPSRSVLRFARAVLPGRRYLVDGRPRGIDSESVAAWTSAVHECLARDGMAALAALVELYRAGRKPTPARVRRIVRKRRGDPEATVDRAFAEVLPLAGVPDALGVFLPAPPLAVDFFRRDCPTPPGPPPTPLDPLTSLAVLAHRSGPLYVRARPVEPSLIVLERAVLVIPEFEQPEGG
jgi:hypothetical protein